MFFIYLLFFVVSIIEERHVGAAFSCWSMTATINTDQCSRCAIDP